MLTSKQTLILGSLVLGFVIAILILVFHPKSKSVKSIQSNSIQTKSIHSCIKDNICLEKGIIIDSSEWIEKTEWFSDNKLYKLVFDPIYGDLTVYYFNNNSWNTLWFNKELSWKVSTQQIQYYLRMKNGNLEIININTLIMIWNSGTANNNDGYAELTNDGEFIIKDKNNNIKKKFIMIIPNNKLQSSFNTQESVLVYSENKEHRLLFNNLELEIQSLTNNIWIPMWKIDYFDSKAFNNLQIENGNLIFLNNNRILWETDVSNNNGYIEVSNNGEFLVKNKDNNIIKEYINYNSKIVSNRLYSNITYWYSQNKRSKLIFISLSNTISLLSETQSNGEKPVYKYFINILASQNTEFEPHYLKLTNSNLEVVSKSSETHLWQSNTSNGSNYIELTNDGDLQFETREFLQIMSNPFS
jgi:hypothetical protein